MPAAWIFLLRFFETRMLMERVSLAAYSNFRIGGVARHFCVAKNFDALAEGVVEARSRRLPIFILGGGTNLLISDRGVRAVVIKPEFGVLKADGCFVVVGAGVAMDALLEFSIRKGLSGLEWAGGLPGTVGGAIRGNAGAFRGEIKDVVRSVVSLPLSARARKTVRRRAEQCRFGYRTSVFKEKSGEEVIVEAVLTMRKGDPKAIRAAIEEKIGYRRAHQPLEYPNIGSIFKNVDVRLVSKRVQGEFAQVIKTDPFPVVPAAALIDRVGLKGVSCGGAMISPKHPNFIVNVLAANAGEVKTLIQLMKFKVKKAFGIALEEEIIYV